MIVEKLISKWLFACSRRGVAVIVSCSGSKGLEFEILQKYHWYSSGRSFRI